MPNNTSNTIVHDVKVAEDDRRIMRGAGWTCGPFAEIRDRIEDFGTALYFSQLYYDTILEHQELTNKLKKAEEDQDEELIRTLQEQICFIEKMCSLDVNTEQLHSEN
jgi:hypothetical protein